MQKMSNKSRMRWANQVEFILSCVAVCVGFGNVWRFPYICFKNGGGAFLLVYCIFLVILVLPQVFLQFTYGQYSSLGPGHAWICCPLFRGVGTAMMAVNCVVGVYYNVIVMWALYYFAMSFSSSLPWVSCDNDWNTEACYVRGKQGNQTDSMIGTPINSTKSRDITYNSTAFVDVDGKIETKTSSEEFWERHVLDLSEGIENLGTIRWQLMLSLLACSLIIALCLIRGIRSSGKVMYVAATLPYVVLAILFIRAIRLPGALEGLKYYLVPRWSELKNLQVWVDVAVQNLYSASLGTGALVNLASFNRFHNSFYKQTFIIVLTDAFTSVFAGCTIFTTLGHMAERSNVSIGDVVDQGPGVVFMVYPETLATLPVPQLWSAMFFVTLFTIGMDSQITHVQVVTVGLKDKFPKIFGNRENLVLVGISSLYFLLGLIFVSQGGMYVLQLVDWYFSSISLLFIMFCEVVALAWIYGTDRLYDNIEMMLGYRPSAVWAILWKYMVPPVILALWIIGIVQHKPVSYGPKAYPSWSIGLGFVIGLGIILPIPFEMVVGIVKGKGSIIMRLRDQCQPLSSWNHGRKEEIKDIQMNILEN